MFKKNFRFQKHVFAFLNDMSEVISKSLVLNSSKLLHKFRFEFTLYFLSFVRGCGCLQY